MQPKGSAYIFFARKYLRILYKVFDTEQMSEIRMYHELLNVFVNPTLCRVLL